MLRSQCLYVLKYQNKCIIIQACYSENTKLVDGKLQVNL